MAGLDGNEVEGLTINAVDSIHLVTEEKVRNKNSIRSSY